MSIVSLSTLVLFRSCFGPTRLLEFESVTSEVVSQCRDRMAVEQGKPSLLWWRLWTIDHPTIA